MNQNTDHTADMDECRKHWNNTLNVEAERRTVLKELSFRAEVLWRLMREKYALNDTDLLSKMDVLKRRSSSPAPGIPADCAECGRAYTIRDTLRAACPYCGSIPSDIKGHIPFDGSSLFAPFPEWLRGTDLTSLSSTAGLSFGSTAAKTDTFHPGSILKGLGSLIMPFSNSIAAIATAEMKRTGAPKTLDKSEVNYAPLLQRYCAVLLSIWEIFREKTDTGAMALAEELFRLLDKLSADIVPSEHRPPFEYLSVLTDSLRNMILAAVSLTDANFREMSDSLAAVRAESRANEPAPVCRVCGRPLPSNKSGPASCIYCGTRIEQDPAAYLFQVRFD